MLVLLPPSEGKAASGVGEPLDPAELSLPALNPARERVLDALVALCSGRDEAAALKALGLSQGLRGEVARNAGLRSAPALPAGRVYTGVLYDALGLPRLGRSAGELAQQSVLIFSGLWGAVHVGDRIPPYRCSMGAKLPTLGSLGAHWRAAMAEVLPGAAGDGLVVDLRSAAYAAVWRPTGEVASRTAAVRVLHERVIAGVVKRSVVSHFNKATKGRLVRDLLQAGGEPRSPAELLTALRDLKYTVEERPAAAGGPRQLDVVVAEL